MTPPDIFPAVELLQQIVDLVAGERRDAAFARLAFLLRQLGALIAKLRDSFEVVVLLIEVGSDVFHFVRKYLRTGVRDAKLHA